MGKIPAFKISLELQADHLFRKDNTDRIDPGAGFVVLFKLLEDQAAPFGI